MFYLLPNMPPILETSVEDEVSIAMVEFEKKKSLARYSRYGSTLPEDKNTKDLLASALIKNSDLIKSSSDEERDYDNLSKRMQCAKRIQYTAGFVTLITIIIVLIITTIQSGKTPSLLPNPKNTNGNSPQHNSHHNSKINGLGFKINEDDHQTDHQIETNNEISNLINREKEGEEEDLALNDFKLSNNDKEDAIESDRTTRKQPHHHEDDDDKDDQDEENIDDKEEEEDEQDDEIDEVDNNMEDKRV